MTNLKEQRIEELRALVAQIQLIVDDLEREQNLAGSVIQNRRRPYMSSWDSEEVDYAVFRASEYYRSRRRRKRFLPSELFGEPAWDMLLDLFIARLHNKRVSVMSACYASDVPSTTALRWLRILVDYNLIERFDSKTDQRVTWVRLTEQGVSILREYFLDSAQSSQRLPKSLENYVLSSKNDNQS